MSATNGQPLGDIPLAKPAEIVITDYITESLDKVAIAEGFGDYELHIDHGSRVGDGFIGIILKVTIREVLSDKELIVLAKLPPQSKEVREANQSMALFEREVFVYNSVLPEFVKLQEERRINDARGFFNFPKVFYADFDEERDESIIVMEDLRQSGHRMWNRFEPINYEHTKLLITALGRLHAISFAMKMKKPELFERFKELGAIVNESYVDVYVDDILKGSLTRALDALEPDDTKQRQKIEKVIANLRDIVNECSKPEFCEPFSVIIHGDCWINNFLFHYKKKDLPDSIVLIDWQVSRYASPIIDLAYFFFICTDQALRAKHFDELLKIYHQSLKDLLDRLGGDTTTQFPFTSMLRQLKKFSKFGVIMSTFIVPLLQTKSEDTFDFDYIMEQLQNESDEVKEETMRTLNEKMSESSKAHAARMRGIILDAVRYGYL